MKFGLTVTALRHSYVMGRSKMDLTLENIIPVKWEKLSMWIGMLHKTYIVC